MKKERKIDAQKSVIKKVVESGSQEIEKHVTKKRDRGITLIALVVTIIIMLILAAVTLNMALGDNGLIQMAKFAANKYEQAAINESLAMQGLVNGINNPESVAPTTTTTPNPTPEEEKLDRSQLNIGDKVNYTPNPSPTVYSLPASQSGYENSGQSQTIKQETYTWKIMNKKEDGTVEIMGVPTSEMQKVYFKGATGYNNGVYLLNDICEKLYSNSDLDATARSIKIEDITEHFNKTGNDKITQYKSGYKTYGETQTYTDSKAYYPKLAKYEDNVKVNSEEMGSLGESDPGSSLGAEEITIPLEEKDLSGYNTSKEQASSSLTVKQTYYSMPPDASYFEKNGELYKNLFFTSGTEYWLASRCSDCYKTDNTFALRTVEFSSINGTDLFRSYNHPFNPACGLAPVVSLRSDIQLTGDSVSGWTPQKLGEN